MWVPYKLLVDTNTGVMNSRKGNGLQELYYHCYILKSFLIITFLITKKVLMHFLGSLGKVLRIFLFYPV